MKFNPHLYQSGMIDWLLELERSALFAPMGSGKTVTVLTALDLLQLVDRRPTLVLAPLRVAQSTWPDEVGKWDHLTRTEVSAVVGDPGARARALKRDASVYTTNYENLPWLIEHLGDRWPFGRVVPDESTRLKGFRLRQGTQRAKALGKVAHSRVDGWVNLTGTPSPNGLQDLWGQSWFLDRGERLGRTFDAFRQRWFQAVPGSLGYTQIKPLPFAQEQIQDKLHDICLTPDLGFKVDEPIVREIRVELPPKARALYRDMERQMFMDLGDGHEVEALNAAAKTNKCLQLANGAAYVGDQGEWKEVHDAKLQALDSIIEEAAGAPILVAYNFKSDLARLQKAVPSGRSLDRDPETIRRWNAGGIRVLFAHPASAGHGLNLQHGGNTLVFFGHNWNLEERDQIAERIGPMRQRQSGYDRPVFHYNIIATDTVDELVIARCESKRSVQDILLEAMKRKGFA